MRKFLLVTLLAVPLAAHAQSKRPPSPVSSYDDQPSANLYQGGVGSPFSNRASNIEGAGTHAEIAPRLPNPDASGDDVHAFLIAADKAMAQNQTGAAQEALERAETRILTRSTDPALASRPDTQPTARAINEARLALGQNDVHRARNILEHVLNPS
jgi:hypothetical protein